MSDDKKEETKPAPRVIEIAGRKEGDLVSEVRSIVDTLPKTTSIGAASRLFRDALATAGVSFALNGKPIDGPPRALVHAAVLAIGSVEKPPRGKGSAKAPTEATPTVSSSAPATTVDVTKVKKPKA